MFSNILGALQGPSVEATDDTEKAVKDTANELPTDPKVDSSFSFWGVASALADTMKQTTADITASVGETDWRAEIEAFRKGVAEDASNVQQQAQHAAREGAARLEALPQQAAKAKFPPVDSAKVKSQLDQVGSTIGQFGTKIMMSSKDLVDQVTEAVHRELDSLEGHINKPKSQAKPRSLKTEAGRYNRLEADISAMQRSSSTYCDEPQDTESFAAWLETFDLDSKKTDIEAVIRENAFMAELQSRIVPLIVQYDTFWTRYFYQLHKITEKHKQMQQVVQRAQSQLPDEDLSWDDAEDAKTPKKGSPPSTPVDPEEGEEDASKAFKVESKQAVDQAASSTPVVSKVLNDNEEEAETSTASDESGAPWTVVSSPSHKRQASEVESRFTPQASRSDEAQGNADSASPKDVAPKEQQEKAVDSRQDKKQPESDSASRRAEEKVRVPEKDDESDIDISDADLAEAGEGESDVEEDWGLWD